MEEREDRDRERESMNSRVRVSGYRVSSLVLFLKISMNWVKEFYLYP